MSDNGIDWKRHDEDYLHGTLGHYAIFERPGGKPEHRSPMQRVMRQIKKMRGKRYYYHLHPGGWVSHDLPDFMHESWFQLPAEQKEEWLLRHVDWSGVTEKTRDQVIAGQLRSRDGEINAHDEWHLHDQLMRVEATTPNWSELSSTAKLETLLRAKDVDWRPFPRDFQAIALGHMIRRVVMPGEDGRFEIGGVFDAGTDYPHFGRYGSSKDRDAFEQSKRKGPKRPVFSKAEARRDFRWAVAAPRWEAFLKEHGDETDPAQVQALKRQFRDQMRPLWHEFWEAAKSLDRERLNEMALERYLETTESLNRVQRSSGMDGGGGKAEGAGRPPSTIARLCDTPDAFDDQRPLPSPGEIARHDEPGIMPERSPGQKRDRETDRTRGQ